MPQPRRRTEEEIERTVEWRTNDADKAFMSGSITQIEYDARMRNIAAWAENHYLRLVK